MWRCRIPVWNYIYSRDEFFQLTVLRLFHTAWAASAVRDEANSDPTPLPAEAKAAPHRTAPQAWAHPGLCTQTSRLYVRKLAMRSRCAVWRLMLIPIMLITALSLEWENAAWCDIIVRLKSNSNRATPSASLSLTESLGLDHNLTVRSMCILGQNCRRQDVIGDDDDVSYVI